MTLAAQELIVSIEDKYLQAPLIMEGEEGHRIEQALVLSHAGRYQTVHQTGV